VLDVRRGVCRRSQPLRASGWSRHCKPATKALAKGVEENAALRGMGCTIVAAWMDTLGIRWASVGDSLLLLYRFPDVIRLNADHSLGSFLDEQARQNRITASEAKQHHNRNALRSALTGARSISSTCAASPWSCRPATGILIASDGICSLERR
jgi:serine/threonine protein phosphatase PrpC